MPCDVRVTQSIKIRSDISNLDRLEQVLKAMGFTQVQRGQNVAYNAGSGTKRDAALVIKAGQTLDIDGKKYRLDADIAFVPDPDDGTMQIVMDEDMPQELVNKILQAYARQTVKDIAKAKGGKLQSDELKSDGSYLIKVFDPVTGKVIYSTIMRDGKIKTEGMGGAKTVCSAITSAIQHELMGIKPHAHDKNGNHIKLGR